MSGEQRGIPFVKASGCGNDFLIIEERFAPRDRASFTRDICDRHNGAGADGVEWVAAGSDECDVSARLVNADGTEAEISGNGTRCVAAQFVAEHGGEAVRVRTGAGVKECRLAHRRGHHFEFSMLMGVPQSGNERRVKAAGREWNGREVSMGNPHIVIAVPDFAFAWQDAGREIQRGFPSGVNVEFVRIVGEHEVECRFFERGAGETQSSGTGSCASAVAMIEAGLVASPVKVVAPGGAQRVEWAGAGTEVILNGPAEIICRGEYFL